MKTVSANLLTSLQSEMTTLAMCWKLVQTNQQPNITAITKANPGIFTTEYAHGYVTNDVIRPDSVGGMIEVNNNDYIVTKLTNTTFSINADTTGFTTYTSGGTARKVLGFTSNQENLTISNVTYKASTLGFNVTAVKSDENLTSQSMDAIGILDSNGINEADIAAGKFDFAEIFIFVVDYKNLGYSDAKILKGNIGSVNVGRTGFTTELRRLSQQVQQVIVDIVMSQCNADLGDTRCGFDISTLTVTGTITSVTDNQNFADSARTEADDYFDLGKFTWTSGNNVGLSMEVKNYQNTGGAFTLIIDMPYAVQIGDGYSVYPGCDKTKTTCKDTFSNVVNFRGLDFVPGPNVGLKFGGQ